MPALKKSTTIPKDVATRNDLDFEYLKRIGIEHIAELGGGIWTDFNEHDPGITTLEMLAYAITDLGNRMRLPMQDLLSLENGAPLTGQFYNAGDILPNRAVTASDYRKLLLDIDDDIRNCWILPFQQDMYANCESGAVSYNKSDFENVPPHLIKKFGLKGLNRLLVDFSPSVSPDDRLDLIEKIREKYHANRNLCEDLVEISEVDSQAVSVCANIVVDNAADEDDVHAHVLFAIEAYFSPYIRFHSLKEMRARGYRMDEIFEGPLLEHGFIDDEELEAANLRSEVRLSDLIRIIMEVPGVKEIRDITMGNCDDAADKDEWIICIDPFKKPKLCGKSTFSYMKDVLPVHVNETRALEILAQLQEAAAAYDDDAAKDRFPEVPAGQYLQTGWYTTIQNDFPDTYGIGREGLAANAGTQRRAQAKQLKGYLLFFDQVLATYFAHLDKVKDLLSVNSHLSNTYFTQAVQGISGFGELVQNYPLNNDEVLSEHLFEGLVDNISRRNELLDHLLARFAEQFSNYAFLMKQLYGSIAGEMVLYSKETFLREYVALSSERGKGFNYYPPDAGLWDTDNVSGAQKRIARLSGMKNYRRRSLSQNPYVEIFESPAGSGTYKWRLRDDTGTTILSALLTYTSYAEAVNGLYAAVLLLIETPEELVRDAFEAGVTNDQLIGNIQVKFSSGSNYYFKVINPVLDPSDPAYFVAQQNLYFSDVADFEQSVLNTIRFAKYKFTDEGMFLVEHILLRPDLVTTDPADYMHICSDDCRNSCCSVDPYSFRVSVVLPGYMPRFSNPDFRNFMEELIREELPAHVLPKICWVGWRKGQVPDDENDLYQFEQSYKTFLTTATGLPALVEDLGKLNTIYPTGKLHDCNNDDQEGNIILGRTSLGTYNI